MSARDVVARYRAAVDLEWQKRWGWPVVPGYEANEAGPIGRVRYEHKEGDFEVVFDLGAGSFKSDLSVRGSRGKWRTQSEVPVILERLAEAWQEKAKKVPAGGKLTADEAKALRAVVDADDRDGNLFSRATTLDVAKSLGWDTSKAYRVLNNLSRKGVLEKGGKVPVNDTPMGYQGDGKSVGWQYWHVHLEPDHKGYPAAALEQIGFKPW